MSLPKLNLFTRLCTSLLLAVGLAMPGTFSVAQIGSFITDDKDLKLAADSPFRDPDVIYLEADELENDEEKNIIIARGSVEGRYQDKTIYADEVRYFVTTGKVFAIGNVVLINADGSSQYADKLELSDELEAGNATNFLARFPEGGQLGSAFAARQTDTGIELYNAYYTACEACVVNGKTKKPTWRLKARKVTQDKDSKSIRYRDAVFEFKGIPVFYTPYLAHPDPSVGRASGFLIPFGGVSGSKGVNIRVPYYFALSPNSELTLTPRVYQRVNPLLSAQYRRKFFSGEINLEGSATYASFFDRRGRPFGGLDFFSDPEEALVGKKWRSHLFANGLFDISDNWNWGFDVGYATDDNYLDRYDMDEYRPDFGLYRQDSRRLTQQLFVVGQSDDFRLATSAFGTVSLRTTINRNLNNPNPLDDNFNEIFVNRENDSILPVIAPKIELTKYFKAPVFGGRIKLAGDTTVLTRALGTNYMRGTGSLNWQRNWIAPLGVEIKPFTMGRFDYFNIQADDVNLTTAQREAFNFTRSLGQVGVDIRWPFLNAGQNVNWIIEPRVQLTQNFGDGKRGNFFLTDTNNNQVSLLQDSLDIDLDQALIWRPNKTTGFDLWQEGFRADFGASIIADWGNNSRANLFLGQSYYSGNDDLAFGLASGLSTGNSDIVGQFTLNLGHRFSSSTRVRYDAKNDAFRRLDTSFSYNGDRFSTTARYYRLDSATALTLPNLGIPTSEISGTVDVKLIDNWSTQYTFYRDIDERTTRRQTLSLIYDDDCTRIEFMYDKNVNNLGIIGNSEGFGIRISLLTLGDFAPE